MPRRNLKKQPVRKKHVSSMPSMLAMAQTIEDLRPVIDDGERFALQFLKTADPNLPDRISSLMLGAACILNKLSSR